MRIVSLKIACLFAAAASAGMAVWAFGVWTNPPLDLEARPFTPWSPDGLEVIVTNDQGPSPASIEAAVARPVFLRSRRPFQVIVQQEVAPSPLAETEVLTPPPLEFADLSLKGIVLNGYQKFALVTSSQIPDGMWLKTGDVINGWTITSLSPNAVTLQSGEQSTQLQLYVDNPTILVGSESAAP